MPRFVFRALTRPLDQLPRRTVLQRAITDHLKAGRHWHWRPAVSVPQVINA